jgi:ankyrin repeat protein
MLPRSRRVPIHYASKHCSLIVVSYLLKYGAFIDIPSVGYYFRKTSLHIALESNYKLKHDMVKLLLENKANSNQEKFGYDKKITPLEIAINNWDIKSVCLLLRHGATINDKLLEKVKLKDKKDKKNDDMSLVLSHQFSKETCKYYPVEFKSLVLNVFVYF